MNVYYKKSSDFQFVVAAKELAIQTKSGYLLIKSRIEKPKMSKIFKRVKNSDLKSVHKNGMRALLGN